MTLVKDVKITVKDRQHILSKTKGKLVSADYSGPLPTSTGGVNYALVMVIIL